MAVRTRRESSGRTGRGSKSDCIFFFGHIVFLEGFLRCVVFVVKFVVRVDFRSLFVFCYPGRVSFFQKKAVSPRKARQEGATPNRSENHHINLVLGVS